MYINPFLAGIFATIVAEVILVLTIIIVSNINANKEGK